MFINFEGLKYNLYLLSREYGIFYRFQIINYEWVSKTMADNIIILDLRSFFSLDYDFIFSVEKFVMIHESIYTLIETFHGFLESIKESIKIFDNEVLLNWIIEHIRSSPINIKISMFYEIIVEETYKVTRVLKLIGIDIVDLK